MELCILYYQAFIFIVCIQWWGAGMAVCLERSADLHVIQLMPLPLTVSCFSKIQIRFTLLVPAHPGSPGQRPLNRCACACGWMLNEPRHLCALSTTVISTRAQHTLDSTPAACSSLQNSGRLTRVVADNIVFPDRHSIYY